MQYFKNQFNKKIVANILIISVLTVVNFQLFSQSKKDYLVTVHTKYGDMNLILFDKTPKHKANFLKLVNNKFYDSTLFHRVIQNFMIQGGDPDSKKAKPNQALGSGSLNYKIPSEISPDFYHKKGALGAAGDGNPEKASSSSQFYIVQGKIWNETELAGQIKRSGRPFTDLQKNTYKSIGGSPHLDGNYTVFGQLIGGFAVLDSVAAVKKDARNRPEIDLPMRVTVQKLKKKKILKKYADKSVVQTYDNLNL